MYWSLSYTICTYICILICFDLGFYSLLSKKVIISICTIYYVFFLFRQITIQNTQYYYYITCYNNPINLIIILVYLCLINYTLTVYKIPTYLFSTLIFLLLQPNTDEEVTASNLDLLNGIVLVHPIILFLFYTIISAYIIYYMHTLISTFYNYFFFFKYNQAVTLYVTKMYLFAISLGMLWAEQELLWGGWWSWDFIETLSLTTVIILFSMLHKNTTTLGHTTTIILILINAMLVVRFNIINSIHSFTLLDIQSQHLFYVVIVIFVNIYIKFFMYCGKEIFHKTINLYLIVYQIMFILLTISYTAQQHAIITIYLLIPFIVFIHTYATKINQSQKQVYITALLILSLIRSLVDIFFIFFLTLISFFLKKYFFKKNILYIIIVHTLVVLFFFCTLNYFICLYTTTIKPVYNLFYKINYNTVYVEYYLTHNKSIQHTNILASTQNSFTNVQAKMLYITNIGFFEYVALDMYTTDTNTQLYIIVALINYLLVRKPTITKYVI